mmetsp:Transcript_1762/g.3922  ORF Transcript_1762/g.3922 Transcript_1762/m.3922 type:complete len:411 (-) Transcript_1762:384-1616(-)
MICPTRKALVGLYFTLLLSCILCCTNAAEQKKMKQQQAQHAPLQVRSLRTPGARQVVTSLENGFVITFSGDGIPVQLNPILLKLKSITGDLSNNGRVILGRTFADFLMEELTQEWGDDSQIADLNGVLVDVVKVETLKEDKKDGLKEIETTLDTTLTFDGLMDTPSMDTINEAVLKALLKTDLFLSDYLLPSGLDEFSSVTEATATLQLEEKKEKEKPKKEDKPKEKDKPVVAQANTATSRSFSFDPNDLKILIPATVGGIAIFLLTCFCLCRNNRDPKLNVSYDTYDDDIDHTVNGSQMGKEEIEVHANMMDYGYHPDGHVDLNSSYGAGHVAMHIPAMDQQSMASGRAGGHGRTGNGYRDQAPTPTRNTAARNQTPARLYNRGSVIDSPSKAESSVVSSEYSEGQYWS